jgi:hypothetical protein
MIYCNVWYERARIREIAPQRCCACLSPLVERTALMTTEERDEE